MVRPARPSTLLLMACLVAMLALALLPTRHRAAIAKPHATAAPGAGGLHAKNGTLVDEAGHVVRLTGVNWYGMETGFFAPGGLEVRNWQAMLDQIVQAGFNTLRLPFSNQFLDDPTSLPRDINYALNPDLQGLHGLSLLDRIVDGAQQRGLKVILDRHRPTAAQQTELWYTAQVPESRWIADWTILASHYRHNPAVIGADLHGEPHGAATWGDGNLKTDWRLAAERAGQAILQANPDWLIIVEGIEQYQGDKYWWGGNLEGAAHYPVQLPEPDKLVYSAHDYGPDVYTQKWFQAASFPQNLVPIWQHYWANLQLSHQATVLIGEFGASSAGQNTEGTWLRHFLDFLTAHGFSYTYWAWNPGSADTGGLLTDNGTTLDQQKMRILATTQAPLVDAPQRAELVPAKQMVCPGDTLCVP